MPILPLEHPESLAATLGVMLYAGEDDASQKRARAARNLRQAKLRLSQACLEDIEYAPARKLDRAAGWSGSWSACRRGPRRPRADRVVPSRGPAAFGVRIAGFLARRQKFPCFRIQGNTPRRTSRRGRTGESGPTRKPVSGEFPVFSLCIRDSGGETGSRSTARSAN